MGEIARRDLREHLAQRALIAVRQLAVGIDQEHGARLRIAGLGGLRPRMVVGHMVEDEVRAQADAGRAQLRGQRFQVGVAAQRRLHLVEAGNGEAAVILALARAQEGQQVQIADAQFLQVGDARGHAPQVAAEVLHVGAIAQHALAEEPLRLRRALLVQRAQGGGTGRMQRAQRGHQFIQPGREAGLVAVQAGQQPAQHRGVRGQALRGHAAQL